MSKLSTAKEVMIFIFGSTPWKRYLRMIFFLISIAFMIVLIAGARFGVSKDTGKFYFEIEPAGKFNINKNL